MNNNIPLAKNSNMKFKNILYKYGRNTFDTTYYVYWFVALLVKIFYFQYTTRINIKPFNQTINNNMIKSSFGLLLIIFSVIFFVVYKYRKRMLFIINIIFSIILIADTLYFRYYYNPINITIIYQISFFDDVTSSIGTLFKQKDIIYFIDIPVHFILVFIIKRLKDNTFNTKIRYAVSVILFVVGILLFNNVYKNSNTLMYQYDRNYAARDLGIVYYHYYDVKNFISEEIAKHKPLTHEEKELVNEFFLNKKKEGIRYKGIGKGKNLIIVQIEALQQFVIGRAIEGQEITPNLNKLISKSIYFDNYYHQVAGGNTSDAEFMTNVSLYPAKSGAVYFRFAQNKYYSLPKELKKIGYNTFACHGYKPSFWNRTNMYRNLGFDKFFSFDNYVIDDKVGWAISDFSFFKQSLNLINKDKPFYSFLVTLSSHHPYDAFKNEKFNVGKYEGTQLGNYLKAAHYVDWAIKTFIQDLKDKGLYDNSIIVFYGDHSAIFKEQLKYISDFLGFSYNEYEWKKIQKIPCIIHVPGLGKGMRVSRTGGEMDLLPTLANIMDLDMPYTMGKDLLNTKNGYAVFRDSSVITDKYMYLSSNDKVYDMKTGKELDKSVYEKEIKKFNKQLFVSDILLGKDYFRKLK